jgi:hypothetical protein
VTSNTSSEDLTDDDNQPLPPAEVVPANLINPFAGKYEQDTRTYYRNDGNKHIKSRGDPC